MTTRVIWTNKSKKTLTSKWMIKKLENRNWPKNYGKKLRKKIKRVLKFSPVHDFLLKHFLIVLISLSLPLTHEKLGISTDFLMHRNQLLPIFRVFSSIHFLDCHSQIKWWAYPSCFHQVWNVKETSNLFINNLEIVFLELSQIAE